MRVSLLLLHDLAGMAILVLLIGLTFLGLALTRKPGEKVRDDR